MIKVYDTEHNFLALLDSNLKDVHTIETLDAGTKSLRFKAVCNDYNLEILQEENYVETKDYSYVIKEILNEDNEYIQVFCSPNIESLQGSLFQYFDCLDMNPQSIYEYCLRNTDWQLEYNSENRTMMTKQEANIIALDAIKDVRTYCGHDIWFDTKNKIMRVYDFLGDDLGAYYSNELNLKLLKKQSNTYDYATVLYPYGKNGLTIAVVNNDKNYLENFTYSNKYIEKVWIDEDIEVADILKRKAENYLNQIAMPRASYKLTLSKLGNSVSIGDAVMIVDKIKRIKQYQRVVKIVRYPYESERDTVEISNLQVDFARTFVNSQKKIEKELKYIKGKISNL